MYGICFKEIKFTPFLSQLEYFCFGWREKKRGPLNNIGPKHNNRVGWVVLMFLIPVVLSSNLYLVLLKDLKIILIAIIDRSSRKMMIEFFIVCMNKNYKAHNRSIGSIPIFLNYLVPQLFSCIIAIWKHLKSYFQVR